MRGSNQVSQNVCPRCFGTPGISGGLCPICLPPMIPRCIYCGETWPKRGDVCSQACADGLAVEFATYGIGSEESAETFAEAEDAAIRWRFGDEGRDF